MVKHTDEDKQKMIEVINGCIVKNNDTIPQNIMIEELKEEFINDEIRTSLSIKNYMYEYQEDDFKSWENRFIICASDYIDKQFNKYEQEIKKVLIE